MYQIMNVTDGVFLTDNLFETRALAREYINKWIIGFKKMQPYYLTGDRRKIDVYDVEFKVIMFI